MCKYCCFCWYWFCGKKSLPREKSKSFEPIEARPIKTIIMQTSSPSALKTDDITTVYKLPTAEFETEEDVLRSHGYQLLKKIGRGQFATVFSAKHLKTQNETACKKVNLVKDSKRAKRMLDSKNELFVLQKIRHPHIVKLYEHLIIDNNLYIFMELAPFGNLSIFVHNFGPLDEDISKEFFVQTLSGVSHLHKNGIAHRDLKLSNLLLNDKFKILVSDFGLSRVAFRTKLGLMESKTYCGTEPYMAPELLQRKFQKSHGYNAFQTDIWALGVILYSMFNNTYPFQTKDLNTMLKMQNQRKWKFVSGLNPSQQLKDILDKMLEPYIHQRIQINQLVIHHWIRDQLNQLENEINEKESKI